MVRSEKFGLRITHAPVQRPPSPESSSELQQQERNSLRQQQGGSSTDRNSSPRRSPTPGAQTIPGPTRNEDESSNNNLRPRNVRYDSYTTNLPEATPVTLEAEVVTAQVRATQVTNEESLLRRLAETEAELRAKESLIRKFEVASTIGSVTDTNTAEQEEFNGKRTLQKDEILVGRLIGKGHFNTVHKVKGIKLDEQSYRWVPRENIQQRLDLVEATKTQKFVIKALGINQLQDPKKKKLGAKRIMYEAKLLSKCVHPNIVQVVGIASIDVLDTDFFFLTHRLEYTLYECIHKTWNKRNRGKPKFLLEQVKAATGIASGLDYLHSRNILFNDLKPENIGYIEGEWKLCNFSKAQSLARKAKTARTKMPYNMDLRVTSVYHGTPPYAAPELSKKIPCNMQVDTFSFAILLWEITSVQFCPGREDGSDITNSEGYEAMLIKEAKGGRRSWKRPDFDKEFPKILKEAVKQCWAEDSRDRPLMKDVHAKLKDYEETLFRVL